MSKAKGIREVSYMDIRQGGGVGHTHAAPGMRMQSMSWFDCAGGGQVVVEKDVAYIGNMRNPHGTLVIDVSDPEASEAARIRGDADWNAFAQGARRQRDHAHQSRDTGGGGRARRDAAARLPRRAWHLRRIPSGQAPAHHQLGGHRSDRAGHRRAPLRLRWPLCVYLADLRGLRRQHLHDPGPQESRRSPRRSAAGGCRASGRRAARSRRGKARRTAATIHCVTATGSTRAIGTAATRYSTSTT